MPTRSKGSKRSPTVAPSRFFMNHVLRRLRLANAVTFALALSIARSTSRGISARASATSFGVTKRVAAVSFGPSNFRVKSSTARSPRRPTAAMMRSTVCRTLGSGEARRSRPATAREKSGSEKRSVRIRPLERISSGGSICSKEGRKRDKIFLLSCLP